jgi:uncharacterized membrane protein
VGILFVVYYLLVEYTLSSICIFCTGVHVCVLALLVMSIKYYGKTPASTS